MSSARTYQNEKHVPVREAAAFSGLSENHLARLCRRGEVSCRLDGAAWYVGESSLVSFLAERNSRKEGKKQALKGGLVRSLDLEPSFVPFDAMHKVGALVVSAALVLALFPSTARDVERELVRGASSIGAASIRNTASVADAVGPLLEVTARAVYRFVHSRAAGKESAAGILEVSARPARAATLVFFNE